MLPASAKACLCSGQGQELAGTRSAALSWEVSCPNLISGQAGMWLFGLKGQASLVMLPPKVQRRICSFCMQLLSCFVTLRPTY